MRIEITEIYSNACQEMPDKKILNKVTFDVKEIAKLTFNDNKDASCPVQALAKITVTFNQFERDESNFVVLRGDKDQNIRDISKKASDLGIGVIYFGVDEEKFLDDNKLPPIPEEFI